MIVRIAVLAVLVSGGAWAAEQTPPPAMDPALVTVLQKDPANRAIPASDKPGAPIVAVIGVLASGGASAMETTAKDFIRANGAAFGFPAGTGLESMSPLPAVATDSGTTLAWQPQAAGVPYPAGTMSFSFRPDGTLTGVTGRYRPLTNVTPRGIDPAAAIRKALAEARRIKAGKLMTGDGVVREYLADVAGGGVQHQFTVDLVVGMAPRGVRVIMGPGGNVISVGDAEQKGVVSANVCEGYDTVSDPSVPYAPKDLKDIKQVGLLSWYKIEGPAFVSESSYSEKAEAFFRDGFRDEPYMDGPQSEADRLLRKKRDRLANPLFLEGHIYYHLMRVHDAAKDWGIDVDKHPSMKFDVWSTRKVNNAAFMPDFTIVFARNNRDNANRHPGMDATLIYHEYGHYLHRVLNENWDDGGDENAQREASAVGEGFADVVAAFMTDNAKVMKVWNGGTADRDLEGEIATRKRYEDVTPPYIYITNPADPEGDKIQSPADGKEGIHAAGQLFSGACWEMKAALGKDSAIKLVIEALKRTPAPHTFKAVANGIMQADAGKNTDKLTPIFTKRGLIGTPVAAPPAAPTGSTTATATGP